MVTLSTLYNAANEGGTAGTEPLDEAGATELLETLAGEEGAGLGIDAQILQETFGDKLVGLTKDQAVAMLYQLLNSIDSDDTTDKIDLKGGGEITAETFKKALVTELGVDEADFDNALTDLNTVFKNTLVTFKGQDTDDVEDDSVTVTEDTSKGKITDWKVTDPAKRQALLADFGEYTYGYTAPEGNATGGQVVKKASGAGNGNGNGQGNGEGDPDTTPDES